MKNVGVIIILVTVLISGWFYWFHVRPSQIKKECTRKSIGVIQESGSSDGINTFYEFCLHSKGL